VGIGTGVDLAGVTLFVDARNLTDNHYVADIAAAVSATASSAIFHPGEGRTLMGGVRARF
jgi:iron complex outermembrane receptor protein